MLSWLRSLIRPDEPDIPEDAIVIGREFAQASEANRQWEQRRGPNEPTLLPSDYDHSRGNLNLINPTPNELDDVICDLCRRYARSDPQTGSMTRDSISMHEFYSLMAFGKRAAVFGLRTKNSETVADGLTAVAMIEQERVDYRDILVCLALLHHTATRIGEDADDLFRRTAKLAEPNVAEMFNGFVTQSSDYRDLRSSWGLDEVETKHGLGFIGWGFEPYDPTVDLKRVAVELAELVATDKYYPGSIEVATALPEVWLSGGDDSRLNEILAGIRGGASISARALPNEVPNYDSQQFTVFLVETADESDSAALVRLSTTANSVQCCKLGTACGKLFCLIVARSFMEAVPGYETQGTLGRFSAGVSETLSRFVG